MKTLSPRRPALGPFLKEGLGLLVPRELASGFALVLGLSIGAALEITALSSVIPFISVVIQPSTIDTQRTLHKLYVWLGSPERFQFVTLLGLGIIVLMLFSTLWKWCLRYALQRYIASCQARLAKDLLHELMHAPYVWYLTRNYMTLSRLVYEDITAWTRSFVQRLLLMSNDFVTAGLALSLMLVVSPRFGLLTIALIGLLSVVCFLLTRPILLSWATRKRQALEATMLAVTQAMAGVRDIKLSSRQDYFVDAFAREFRTASVAHGWQSLMYETPSLIMVALGQIALVTYALVLWRHGMAGAAIASQLALVIVVTGKGVPAVNGIASSLGDLWNAFPCIRAIGELRGSIRQSKLELNRLASPGSRAPLPDRWKTLRLDNVGFQYPNSEAWALRHLSFRFEQGKCYGIVGRSGAGKSTLVDLMAALLRPQEGQLILHDRPLPDYDLAVWQKRIGYVPQAPFIIDDTLRANVAFGISPQAIDDAWLASCLDQASLGELVSQLENGVHTRLGDRGSRFSGGQKQRIAIARALYNKPSILIFDEATSALDSITESQILATLEQLRKSLTVIVIAHRLSTIRACDRIVLLEEGRLIAEGSYHDLESNHALFKKMAADFKGQPEALERL